MTVFWKTISDFYINRLQPTFAHYVSYLMQHQFVIYGLILALIILLAIRAAVKNVTLKLILEIIGIAILLALLTVGYYILAPMVSNSLRVPSPINTSDTSSQSVSPSDSSNNYKVNCSSCWAENCPPDGYNYYGSDTASYNRYVDICKKCDCKSFRAESTPK